jgi:coproporphyrinogen III oxidase
MSALLDRAAEYFRELQERIVTALEALDGARFRTDSWDRPGGGGGRSRVLADGNLFEKAGVNFSDVHGVMRPELAGGASGSIGMPGQGTRFRATGVSLVLHPRNPHVPTVHANFRRLERGGEATGEAAGEDAAIETTGWFGGGADLTPYYLYPEDATHFHTTLKSACDAHDPSLFPRFKAWCDRYFFIPHRGEPRGLGGVFFDYLGAGAEQTAREPVVASTTTAPERDPERAFALVRSLGDAFLPAYLPIAERRRELPFTPEQRRWQLIRRGRYVEFNLVYDRGTLFGLKTDGRIESILMSLPTEARWEYCHEPAAGSREAETLEAIRAQKDWTTPEPLPRNGS